MRKIIILYWADPDQPRQDKKSLVPARQPNEPTKEGPPSFVLRKSQFASVSTVRRGHPSLVSLIGSLASRIDNSRRQAYGVFLIPRFSSIYILACLVLFLQKISKTCFSFVEINV